MQVANWLAESLQSLLLAGGSYREAVLGTLFSLNNETLNAWSTSCGFCFITCLYLYSMCAATAAQCSQLLHWPAAQELNEPVPAPLKVWKRALLMPV